MRQQLKLWDSKRERKLTGPNTLLAVRRTKGLMDPREELAGGGPVHPAGGRRQGGGERGKLGPRDGTPYQTANRLPVCLQAPKDFLRFWMVDIRCWEDRG